MNDELDEIARIGRDEAKAGLAARIERERRIQTRARRVRAVCRYVILIAGLGGVGLFALGIRTESNLAVGFGCSLFLPTLIAMAILFFMGGMAPTVARRAMTDRERDLLDK